MSPRADPSNSNGLNAGNGNSGLKNVLRKFLNVPKTDEIEIEIRLGTIESQITGIRMDFKSIDPIAFSRLPAEYHFVNGISKSLFEDISRYFDEWYRSKSLELPATVEDEVSIGRSVRRIRCAEEVQYQRKAKRAVVTIYMPGMPYDVRATISIEKKTNKPENERYHMVRRRERRSYKDEMFSYDFTVVSGTQYEFEIEIADPNYDRERFIELILKMPLLCAKESFRDLMLLGNDS